MPIVKCKICKNKFYAKPNWLKKGFGKFCSAKCQHLNQRNGRFVDCFICNKLIYRSESDLGHSKSKKYFCSKSCQTLWRNSIVYIGSNHPNWKDGGSTYKQLLIKQGSPKICRKCKIDDIRILAVHHLDRDRQNNTKENLIWLCHNCHFLIHHNRDENQKLMETLV